MIFPMNPALLELLLLSIIQEEDSYGYQIGQKLKCISELKDSSLYPILKRLSDENQLEIYDRQFQGRNRKYYHLTETGEERLILLRQAWNEYTRAVNEILCREGLKDE